VVVTTGPTGEACALNTPVETPLFDRPVAVLAPKDPSRSCRPPRKGDRDA
jgi:hypothetical protein